MHVYGSCPVEHMQICSWRTKDELDSATGLVNRILHFYNFLTENSLDFIECAYYIYPAGEP
jgi:hypothetical protein